MSEQLTLFCDDCGDITDNKSSLCNPCLDRRVKEVDQELETKKEVTNDSLCCPICEADSRGCKC